MVAGCLRKRSSVTVEIKSIVERRYLQYLSQRAKRCPIRNEQYSAERSAGGVCQAAAGAACVCGTRTLVVHTETRPQSTDRQRQLGALLH